MPRRLPRFLGGENLKIEIKGKKLIIKYKDYNEYIEHKQNQPKGLKWDGVQKYWYADLKTYTNMYQLKSFVTKYADDTAKDDILSVLDEHMNVAKIYKNYIHIPHHVASDHEILIEIGKFYGQTGTWSYPDSLGTRMLLNQILGNVIPIDFKPRNVEATLNFNFLMPHQVDGVNWIISKYKEGYPGILLADDMGLGKTVQSLAVYFTLKRVNPDLKLVVVATKSTLRNAWAKDMKKFFKVEPQILRGDQIAKLGEDPEAIYVTNYELVARGYTDKAIPKLDGSYILILDEATKVKNYATDNAKSIMHLRGDSFVMALTGTPVENNAEELENILRIITNNNFMPHWFYERTFLDVERIRFGTKHARKIVGHKNMKLLNSVVSNFMLRRTKRAITSHDKNIIAEVVDITDEQSRLIETVKAWAERRYRDDTTARYACSVLIKRINDHPLLLKMGGSEIGQKLEIYDTTAPKLEKTKEILKNTKLPVVIFTEYEDMAEILQQELSKDYKPCIISGKLSVKQRDQLIDAVEKGEYNVLIATDALTFGVNLQFIDTLINYDLPWNPAKRAQRVNRIHRIGSTENKVIYDILTSDLDVVIYKILQRKLGLFANIVEGRDIRKSSVYKEIAKFVLEGELSASYR